MATISSSIVTALVGLLGVVFGTLIGHYFNQRLNLRNSRKDIIFRKKLEYFERIAEAIEKNIKMYKNAINAIKANQSQEEIDKAILEMKEKRKNFVIMASPLYLDVKKISKIIIHFVEIEKGIFNKFEKLKKSKVNNKNLAEIEEKMESLRQYANKMLNEMRLEIKK